MSKLKSKDLKGIDFISDGVKSLAMELLSKNYKHSTKTEKLDLLRDLLKDPNKYIDHEYLSKLANHVLGGNKEKNGASYKLNEEPKSYPVYGKKFISDDTLKQMDVAMQLPIAVKGALMPDAHNGYGLPIGGVLAAKDAVIPYGVGLDIGCRMSLNIFDVSEKFLSKYSHRIKTALIEQTHFGIGKLQNTYEEHEVLDRPEFREIELLRVLHGKAKGQIGTSGSGNHFVEVGTVALEENNILNLEKGNYLGVLAHSGSRGLGASIANYYTRVAMEKCWLPKRAQHLAWLDLSTSEGQEYWKAMSLAGDYAKACHDVIHRKMAKALGLKPVIKIENHHNFAWKEIQENGTELIVHRKGATPANKNELGIIPATMVDPGYIVSGKGEVESINSASHGAGRQMSRKKAKESITGSELKKILKDYGITLIGGGLDEAPIAYKNIDVVMESQKELVKIEGKFYPKIVKMDNN